MYNGVYFEANSADGTISAYGTATDGDAIYSIGIPHLPDVNYLPEGNYYLSGCPSGGSASTFHVRCMDGDERSPSWDGTTPSDLDIGNGT